MSADQENKTSVDCRRVHSRDDMKQPGDLFFWHIEYKDGKPERAYVMVWLPGEPKRPDSIPVQVGPAPADHTWGWDGDFDKPTFTPSIHHKGVWHGFMKKGRLESC